MKADELLSRYAAGERDFESADLRGAYLRGADLRCAHLAEADLADAHLADADLAEAHLRGADLRGADLRGAHLRGADLRGAYLRCADLRRADLEGANLRRADLRRADLEGANLRGADLRCAHLADADLAEADLTGTCLDPDRHVSALYDDEITDAGLEIDTVDGREIVRGWRTLRSQYVGSHEYEYTPGWHVAPVLSLCTETECHPGIYLSSAAWLDEQDDYRGLPRVRCWAYRDELVHAGEKWRAQRIFVENEGGER